MAAEEVSPSSDDSDSRAILIRLIPAKLLLGQLPPRDVLETYNLVDAYQPFITAFKDGDIASWRRLLAERREWLRARSVWLLWHDRGEILVWRNLFRHA